MHCREILFTPRYILRVREFPRSVNFFLQRTVAELWGVKVAQFSDFGLSSPHKTLKTYLPVFSLQPRGYITEWFWFFHVIVEGPKGCLPVLEISCNFWLGSWGPPNLPKFSPMANGYIHTEWNCTAHQIWTNDTWKCVDRRSLHPLSSMYCLCHKHCIVDTSWPIVLIMPSVPSCRPRLRLM